MGEEEAFGKSEPASPGEENVPCVRGGRAQLRKNKKLET